MTAPAIDPRSAAFRWSDRPADAPTRLAPADIHLFNREGYCVLRGALAPESLAALLADLDALEAELDGTVITLGGETAFAYDRDAFTFVKNPIR
ncbi:MAG: hypothetical protein MI723_09840, partial [Caulobacterales bacterium]|nr:hypothetical protein [Caulobacterales bacterium]